MNLKFRSTRYSIRSFTKTRSTYNGTYWRFSEIFIYSCNKWYKKFVPLHSIKYRLGLNQTLFPAAVVSPITWLFTFIMYTVGHVHNFLFPITKSSMDQIAKGKMMRVSAFCTFRYEGGPKNNRNLNVARELEVVARCTVRCRESTQYSSALPRGVSLGWVLLLLRLFF
jgi:hypothetical protein